MEAHVIDEHSAPGGRKATRTGTGRNPAVEFNASWAGGARTTGTTYAAGASRVSGTRATNTAGTTRATAGSAASPGSRIAGVAQAVAGVGLMAVGVPLLILPGPGVAVIAGGAMLAGAGVKKALGKR